MTRRFLGATVKEWLYVVWCMACAVAAALAVVACWLAGVWMVAP